MLPKIARDSNLAAQNGICEMLPVMDPTNKRHDFRETTLPVL
jgi:hypothetical protein